MKKILLSLDFNTNTRPLAEYAVQMAAFLGAEVRLVNVIPEPVPAYISSEGVHLPIVDLQTILQKHIEKAEEEMVELMHFMQEKIDPSHNPVTLSNNILVGDTSYELMTLCNTYQPDLIIVGNQHRSPLQKTFFGSVTRFLIDQTDYPILAVPPEAEAAFSTNVHVAYASDFEESDRQVLERVYDLFGKKTAEFHCVHIIKSVKYPEVLATRAFMAEILEEHLNKEATYQNLHTEILDGDKLDDTLITYIQDNKLDFLAVNTHKRNFLGRFVKTSLTQQILHHANMPVLILREVEEEDA